MSVRAVLQLFFFRRRSAVVAPIFRLRERVLILQEQIHGDTGQQNSKWTESNTHADEKGRINLGSARGGVHPTRLTN